MEVLVALSVKVSVWLYPHFDFTEVLLLATILLGFKLMVLVVVMLVII